MRTIERIATAGTLAALGVMGLVFLVVGFAVGVFGGALQAIPLGLGGAWLVVCGAVGVCNVIAGRTLTADRQSVRGLLALVLIALGLFAVTFSLGLDGDDDLTLTIAVRRLEAAGFERPMSDGAERYYVNLYGPTFGADHVSLGRMGPAAVVFVLTRDGGYERGSRPDLEATIGNAVSGVPVAVVEHGVAVVFTAPDDDAARALTDDIRRALAG